LPIQRPTASIGHWAVSLAAPAETWLRPHARRPTPLPYPLWQIAD